MIIASILFFIIYTIALGIIVAVGYMLQKSKERSYLNDESKIESENLVVLIPFRNEEHRINDLLSSILELKTLPKEFVFIDDHSEDNTVSIIEEKLKRVNFQILSLPEGVTGKKRALRFATVKTESTYILTIDADVQFESDYFASIAKLGEADMYVLPAILKAKKWIEHFYEIDLLLVTATNTGLAGLKRPIMASGANLLYKRETFEAVDNLNSHIHAASGDDTYLLRDFRENKADVRLHTDPKCAVTTETPQSLKEFFDQRLRWIGKTTDIKDHLSTALAIIQAVLTISFFVFLIVFGICGEWKYFGILLGIKIITDLMLFYPYCSRVNRLSSWLFIPIYELLFPLYTIVLMVLLATYKPRWKGREIYQKKD